MQSEVAKQEPRQGEEKNTMAITLTYGSVKVEFSGSPEHVLSSVNSFVAKEIPAFNLASKIMLAYGVQDLIETFGNFVKITPEGPRVWTFDRKLSDKELIALQLVGARIAAETGSSGIQLSKGVTLAELQVATGLNPKSISSRLSELTKAGFVERDQTDASARYRITTRGIAWLKEFLAKKPLSQRVTAASSSGQKSGASERTDNSS